RPGQYDRLNALADEFAAALEAAQKGLRYAVRVWVLSDEIEWSRDWGGGWRSGRNRSRKLRNEPSGWRRRCGKRGHSSAGPGATPSCTPRSTPCCAKRRKAVDKLKRYRHGARNGVMTPDPEGPFVRYEDVAAA